RDSSSTRSTSRSVTGTPKSLARSSSSSRSSEPSSTPPRMRTLTSVNATSLIRCQSDLRSSLCLKSLAIPYRASAPHDPERRPPSRGGRRPAPGQPRPRLVLATSNLPQPPSPAQHPLGANEPDDHDVDPGEGMQRLAIAHEVPDRGLRRARGGCRVRRLDLRRGTQEFRRETIDGERPLGGGRLLITDEGPRGVRVVPRLERRGVRGVATQLAHDGVRDHGSGPVRDPDRYRVRVGHAGDPADGLATLGDDADRPDRGVSRRDILLDQPPADRAPEAAIRLPRLAAAERPTPE